MNLENGGIDPRLLAYKDVLQKSEADGMHRKEEGGEHRVRGPHGPLPFRCAVGDCGMLEVEAEAEAATLSPLMMS